MSKNATPTEGPPPPEERRETGFVTTTLRKFIIWLVVGGASLGINGKQAVDRVWPQDERPVCEQLAQCQPRYDLAQDIREMRDELRDIAEQFRRGEITEQEALARASASVQRRMSLTEERRALLREKLRKLAGSTVDFVIELWLEELIDALLSGQRPTPTPAAPVNSSTSAATPTQTPSPAPAQSPSPRNR